LRILLTGAGGQLGLALRQIVTQHELLPRTHTELDIAEPAAVAAALDALAPEGVLNAAAYTAVDGAESEPELAYRVNEAGARTLAEATARRAIPLLHVSTDYVFDGEKGAPYVESDPVHPISVYGASKLAGEEAVRRANPRHYIVRTAWLYGPVGRNFALSIRAAAARGGPLRVVDDQWGSPSYAPHLARARAADRDRRLRLHHANPGDSRFEFARALRRLGSRRPSADPHGAWPTPPPPAQRGAAAGRTSSTLPDWREGVRFRQAVGRRD
jgi:dTDP-4-dehydrorhamnose reductase